MKSKDVITNDKIDKTLDPDQRNKMVEAKITITPHPRFAGEVMAGNKRISIINLLPIELEA